MLCSGAAMRGLAVITSLIFMLDFLLHPAGFARGGHCRPCSDNDRLRALFREFERSGPPHEIFTRLLVGLEGSRLSGTMALAAGFGSHRCRLASQASRAFARPSRIAFSKRQRVTWQEPGRADRATGTRVPTRMTSPLSPGRGRSMSRSLAAGLSVLQPRAY